MESFTYNLRNQLIGYQNADVTASYTYGANGLRKSKEVNGTETGFVWNGSNLAAELDGSSIAHLYNYGADGISSVQSGNTTQLYLKNAHGDVVGKSDTNGTVENDYCYDAFGNGVSDTTPDPFGYCGEYLDNETGLIYLRARYYDSTDGMFITEDPAKDGLNWYSYCAGNPVMFWDPLGLTYVPLRETVEEAGGTVTWNEDSRSATVNVNDLQDTFYEGDYYGTYIQDGVMYVEDFCVNSMIYAPKGLARTYYNNIQDYFGKFVFVAWMTGDGSKQIVEGASWNGFIKYNPYVKERLAWLIPNAINDDGRIYNISDTNLSGGTGGYDSGYALINGANIEVGGFLLKGHCSYIGNGNYSIGITFQFNDIIDPNGIYRDDIVYSLGAKLAGYECKDYQLTINGNFGLVYNLETGLNY